MSGAAFLSYAVAVPLIRTYPTPTVFVTRAVALLALAGGSVLLSALADRAERRRWLRRERYSVELAQLRTKLYDLLPEEFARRTLRLAAPPPCERRWAAVLQLDVAGFTAMSTTLPPLELAGTMHSLFCAFDAEVRARGLFKMDTVGDAYICAGFLPGEGAGAPAAADGLPRGGAAGRARVCEDMLSVAGEMLRLVAAHRWPEGATGSCRIGLAAGSVVAGALGLLQPRYRCVALLPQAAQYISLWRNSGDGCVLAAIEAVLQIHRFCIPHTPHCPLATKRASGSCG
jgi:class 3 adenylate cyclase